MPPPRFVALVEYEALSPRMKGYVCYMQAAHPESPIPDKCPYLKGSPEADEFAEGEFEGILEAMECDE